MQSNYSPQAPPEIQGLNWGAFLLNWIWAIANQVWIGLAALVPCVGLFVAIYLLIKGNELAWTGPRQWESAQQFQEVQAAWLKWGLIALAVNFVCTGGIMILYFGVIMAALSGQRPG